MENLQQELKSMLYLSGRMNRRSYFMNLYDDIWHWLYWRSLY